MATNRTRRTRERRSLTALGVNERLYLLNGWAVGKWNHNTPMPNAEQLWRKHKDELLAYWLQEPESWKIPEGGSGFSHARPGGPKTRPWAWWEFEAPEPLRGEESERDYLARHNLLLPKEQD